MTILCYVRPWNKEQFCNIAKGINSNAKILYVSEHQNEDSTKIISNYYKKLTENKVLEKTIEKDMIERCRLLRNIEYKEASRHLNSMIKSSNELFEKYSIDLVLSITIDSFVIDSLYYESLKRDIKFIGLIPSFINGYVRITARGEHNNLRDVLLSEVEVVYDNLIKKNYQPSFIQKSKKSPKANIFKRWIKELIKPSYFFIKRLSIENKYNYHYWSAYIVSKNNSHIFPKFELGTTDYLDKLTNKNNLNIYLPLQLVPEATIDYWCDKLCNIKYECTLINFINKMQNITFFIKEHPNVLGYRNPSIYKKLEKIENVVFVNTLVDSNELVDKTDATLVWTGTAGFESLLRNKPILSFCNSYYRSDGKIYLLEEDTTLNQVKDYIKNFDNSKKEDKLKQLNFILSGLLKGNFKNNGTWSSLNKDDIQDSLNLGKEINKVI